MAVSSRVKRIGGWTMGELAIRRGGWDDERRLGALLAVSFAADPFVRWLMPDASTFIDDSRKHPRRAYSAAFDAGTVWVIGDFAGAALWIPPGAKSDRSEEIEQSKQSEYGTTGSFPPDYAELLQRSAAYCPEEPHWYLGIIAVDPFHRGKGLGGRLMEHGLKIVDRDRLPAYLESTSAANLTLYRRAGFEILAEVRVGDAPPRYPMLRPARK